MQDNGFQLFINLAAVFLLVMMGGTAALVPYRKEPAARSLIGYLVLVSWLLVMSILELFAPPGPLTIFFAKLEYLAYIYIPLAWISFCFRYTGWFGWTNKILWKVSFFAAAPLFALVMTNDWHGLLWREIAFVEWNGLSVLRPSHGPVFWCIFAINWSFIAGGTLIIYRSFFSGQRLYYRQSLWILAGVLFPGILNLVNLSHIVPGLLKDFTPIGHALSGACFLTGMYFHRLFWVMPVARSVILQDLDIGILVLDRDGFITDHNHAIDQLLGLPAVSVGRRAMTFPELARFFSLSVLDPENAHEAPESGIIEWDSRHIAWTRQATHDPTHGTIITAKDVSEQVALQHEMSMMKNEFIKREKLATIGRLTAGLAHEINNPLAFTASNVRSLNRMMERSVESGVALQMGEMLEVTRDILAGIERIGNVVSSLLSFSRQGTMDSEFSEYDLHAGIDTTLEFIRYELRGTIDVDREYSDIPRFLACKNEINQVLFNILTNAVHSIRGLDGRNGAALEDDIIDLPKDENEDGDQSLPKGRITVRTGTEGKTVWCEIENNGPAIPEEHRPRIFELFFTTKAEKWGTGLGLNLCRDIVEHHHHGRLTLASANPVVFRMELPIIQPSAVGTAASTASSPAASSSAASSPAASSPAQA